MKSTRFYKNNRNGDFFFIKKRKFIYEKFINYYNTFEPKKDVVHILIRKGKIK